MDDQHPWTDSTSPDEAPPAEPLQGQAPPPDTMSPAWTPPPDGGPAPDAPAAVRETPSAAATAAGNADGTIPNPLPGAAPRLRADAIEDPDAVPGLGTDDAVMLGGVSGSTVTANARSGPAQEAPRAVFLPDADVEWIHGEPPEARARRIAEARRP